MSVIVDDAAEPVLINVEIVFESMNRVVVLNT